MVRVSTYSNRKGERRFQIALDAEGLEAFVAGDLNDEIAKGLKAAAKQAKK